MNRFELPPWRNEDGHLNQLEVYMDVWIMQSFLGRFN